MANRRFYHFLDSVFGISRSASDNSLLYIKQIKCRNRPFSNGDDNVILARVKKKQDSLSLETIGNDKEKNHLPIKSSKKSRSLGQLVVKLRNEGLSFSQIAEKLCLSKTHVQRLFNIMQIDNQK